MTLGQFSSSWGLHPAVVLLGMWTSLIIEWTSPANFWKGENCLVCPLMNTSELLYWGGRQVVKKKLVLSLLFSLPSPAFSLPSANSMPQHFYTQSSWRRHILKQPQHFPLLNYVYLPLWGVTWVVDLYPDTKVSENLHVYLALTIHLPLIQVSREWSNLVPSMTSTTRQCWSISDHLLAELCAVFRTPGRAMEEWPPVCRVMGCAACAKLSPLRPGTWTQGTPVCVTVGHRSCWEDLLQVAAWTVPPGLRPLHCYWESSLLPSLTVKYSASMQLSNAN